MSMVKIMTWVSTSVLFLSLPLTVSAQTSPTQFSINHTPLISKSNKLTNVAQRVRAGGARVNRGGVRPNRPVHRSPSHRPPHGPGHRPPGHRPPGHRPPGHKPPHARPPHRPGGGDKTWVRIRGGVIPATAAVLFYRGSVPVYSCQAEYNGQIYTGTVVSGEPCYIKVDGKTISVQSYSVQQ